ncbi:tetratricopeptide repeat protein [Leptolyngbya sp. PCC 7375]|nr:tetratricopeptide repeat protein [Leptolyngbya sp. PCC 7375]
MGNLWIAFWQWLSEMWQVALNNSDATQILLALLQTVLALLPFLGPVAIVIFRRRRRRKTVATLISDISPFEKIIPYSDNVLWRLLGGSGIEQTDDPLADYNIPYQVRISGRNIRREIIDRMERTDNLDQRWVLILGRSGLGKSREAAQVAKALNDDGWAVLNLKTLGWERLSRPDVKLMENLGDQKLLFFLDDVNRMIPLEKGRVGARGLYEQAKLAETHPLDRLLEVLKTFEDNCRAKNVRVIATARNEPVAEKAGEPSELEKLGLDRYKLWQRFQQYELSDPEIDTLVTLQQQGVAAAKLQANPEEFKPLAVKSDRTMRVFVNNLREARRENLPLEQVSEDNLQNSWKSLYKRAKQQHRATPHIYAAAILLRSLGVGLQPMIVLPTARMLVSRRKTQVWGWLNYWPMRRALNYLTAIDSTSILTPKDGQLEAVPISIEQGEHIPNILKLLLRLSKKQPSTDIMLSLNGFGETVYEMGRYTQALTSFKRVIGLSDYLENVSDDSQDSQSQEFDRLFLNSVWFLQGNCHYFLSHREEAIACYDAALAIKPDKHEALLNKGVSLDALGHREEAIACYDAALAIKPDKHEALLNKGVSLDALGHREEAIACYDAALAIKPDLHEALYNKGVSLDALGHREEAIACYDAALAIKPDLHEALLNKGVSLDALGHREEAIACYDAALAIKPDKHEALYNKGVSLDALGHREEAIACYDAALVIKPDKHEALLNKGVSLDALGHREEAIACYDAALAIKPGPTRSLGC